MPTSPEILSRDGRISDAKTIVALLFWNAWRRGASNAVKGNA